ncbi:MAG: class I SAM-dependent methyltransferase [Okeania sp. SIO2H7]|nr:class I SAM-dependent methyltransferase [Okeania sp. SIO2H7]
MSANQRESTENLTGVIETLTITLYSRYLETGRTDSLFQDPKAVEIVEKVDYDFDKYAKGWASQLGVIIRVKEFDRIVQNFADANPNAIIVNLGCGLCTRATRINSGSIRWYEIDFPEAIEFRRKFFEESDRDRFIAKSILDFTWIDEIERSPNQPLLIVMEGVSPYLSELENKSIVGEIRDRLAPTDFVFDVLNRKSAKNTKGHDTVSKTDAEFQFGIDKGKEIENWGTRIKLKDEIYYLEQFPSHPQRLPFWARYLSFILVRVFKNSARILHLQIAKD